MRCITKENTIDRPSLKLIQLLPFIQNKALATKDMEVTHLGCATVHELLAGFLLMHSEVVPRSEWVSPVHCVPKKGGLTVVKNEKNELIPQRTVTGWQMCIDYRKLNKATKKDHFPLPFIDEMLERLANHTYFCFLDGFSGFMQIPIHPGD
jgi:hypothetical protein